MELEVRQIFLGHDEQALSEPELLELWQWMGYEFQKMKDWLASEGGGLM